MAVAEHIEHTLLKADASVKDIMELCQKAKEYGLFGVCVNPCYVQLAKNLLSDCATKVVTVIGFPLGADLTAVKAFAAKKAVEDRADEIDMVINIAALKGHNDDFTEGDIRAVVEAAAPRPVKVIIETCLLNEEEKIRACRLIAQAGAAFVKTSTGFSRAGATVEDVELLHREAEKYGIRVKAAGGIRTYEDAMAMLRAGAERLGTSAGDKIAAAEKDA